MNKIKKTIEKKDLVLVVSNDYDVNKLKISLWEEYLNILCKDRYYQKDAIKTALIYLIGGNYNSLWDLGHENYIKNPDFQTIYKTEQLFKNTLSFEDKLFANIDLVTGSGKSFVMYGIAQIMLALGYVDKVLVLCPNVTIEQGLTEKFTELSSNQRLINAIPIKSKYANPSITNANKFVNDGEICIENIHSIYERTNSSIEDSFKGIGQRVLVLNDESHHIFLKSNGNDTEESRKWKDFLNNKDYNFKFILGFTGTPYCKNEYFSDVIYRYSFIQGTNDKVIKKVRYVSEGIFFRDDHEKFQIIIENHNKIKQEYKAEKIKPITMLVTKDIKDSKLLGDILISHLVQYNINLGDCRPKESLEAEAKNSVLVINYNSSTEERIKLQSVDDYNSSIEFVIGVSMLNEGWDVKNIFQIVPMEQKAFDSRLLIAQVLGRGLRIPSKLKSQPTVTVLNHHSWSKNIEPLLKDIIQNEQRITVSILNEQFKRHENNFILHNINYKKEKVKELREQNEEEFDADSLLSNGITLVSEGIHKETVLKYKNINGEDSPTIYKTRRTTYTIEETVNKIFSQLNSKVNETKSLTINDEIYDKTKITKEFVTEVIRKSLINSNITDGVITDRNQDKILTEFEPILNRGGYILKYKPRLNDVEELFTKDMNQETISLEAFRDFEKPTTLFFTDKYFSESMSDYNGALINEFVMDKTYPEFAKKKINSFVFKTATNYIITQSTPEFDFVEKLCSEEYQQHIDSWIKSKNTGFYGIKYDEVSENGDIITKTFNPDFFIKITHDGINYISVVEIKGDDDVDITNKAKFKFAKDHFEHLNKKLAEKSIKQIYLFNFLSPCSYFEYFKSLAERTILNGKFNSALDVCLAGNKSIKKN